MSEGFKKINPVQVKAGDSKTDQPEKSKGRKRKIFFVSGGVLLALLLLIAVPVAVLAGPTIASARQTYRLAQQAYEAGKNQDLPTTSEKLRETEEALKQTQEHYQKLAYFSYLPFASQYYQDGKRALSAGLDGIQAGRIFVDAVIPYADVLGFKGQGSFMGGTAEDRIIKIVQTLDKVTPKIGQVAEKLTAAQTEINQIDPNRYPVKIKGIAVRDKLIKVQSGLDEAVVGVTEARPILTVLPQILGYPNSKRYLVIFQNDGELRPTGGFMTAFAVLHLDSGKVKPEKSDDIYSLDKKFNQSLPAPEPIEKYLFGEDTYASLSPNYYLRDMNFSPDYRVSMEEFIKYYEQLEGEYEVDGIIAIDTYVLRDLVQILGPINVPGYGEFTVEPDERCHGVANIICELEYIVDQPLPTQVANRKKSILGPMMQELMFKAMGSPKQLWPQLFSTGLRFLEEKHALLYFKDEELQNAAEAFGAAGRIKKFGGDYLHVNNANFGGAKANLFTEHKVEQEIEINEAGEITKTVTLSYHNPEPVDNCDLEREAGLCLNSTLPNYVRIYVPQGSELVDSLGSKKEVEVKEGLGKTYFDGFLTVHGGGGRAKMMVKYRLPFKLSPEDDYSLFIQKQPGREGDNYQIFFGDQEEDFSLRTDRKFKFSF